MAAWPPPLYEARVTLRVPLSFAFRWCTDYSAQDPALEKVEYQRKVLEKTRTRRVYEDLYDRPTGWIWSRAVVTLRPPNGWHDEERGSHCDWSLDYELSSMGREQTQLRIRGWRRRTALGSANPPNTRFVDAFAEAWKGFGRKMEQEYLRIHRRSRKARRRPERVPRGDSTAGGSP